MDHALHHLLEPSAEYDVDLTVTAGRWPAGISGRALLIGPAQPNAIDFMFAGPGMITDIDLATRHWRTSRVLTPDLAILGGLRQVLAPADLAALMVTSRPALTNVAPQPFGDRLMLTGLTQRPVEVDPVTLEFTSFLGGVDEYPQVVDHPLWPGVRTAAHPVEDLDEGCLWWCNTSLRPRGTSRTDVEGPLWLVRWDGEGEIDTWYVPGAHLVQGVHEVTVTEDYVILTEIGFQPEPGSVAGRDRTRPHQPFTDIYLVAKRDLTRERRGRAVGVTHARVPRESFHHFADYRQDGDDVTIYVAHSNGWDLNYSLRDTDQVWGSGEPMAKGLHGFVSAPVDASPVGRYVIEGRTGEVREARTFLDADRHWATLLYGRDLRAPALEHGRYLWQAYWGCDPGMLATRVVELYRDHPYRAVPVDRLPTAEIPSSLVCLDLETMTEQAAWSFPSGTAGESPVYVPDSAGGPGWVALVVHHTDRTELQLFDALSVGAGPVAVACAPGLKLAVQFHSAYLPALPGRSGAGARYRRPYADDLGTAWRELPAPARAVVGDVLGRYS
ncbi:carotenoid oxygenase family protein [Frankia sp. AgKG'84/4]|uniref:carotenoid oxygenase family protein n=1 Tax=Frankia sp. AgKG'84/4 TaxID=573490 RepID=UPI00200F9FAA|nr:carotenoid oxygenase family protein [Frankia sp. AgKG'84/4]MCL9795231.1 carotenoid oxygenase family protein [Frankia sp. AgKG'84/4]